MAIFDQLKSIWKVLLEAARLEQYRQISEQQKKIQDVEKKIASYKTNWRQKIILFTKTVLIG